MSVVCGQSSVAEDFSLLLLCSRHIDNRHTGRGEAPPAAGYPVAAFFWIPDNRFAPSGMTGSANRDIVSKGRRDSCGAKLIGVIDIRHSDSNSSVISVVLHCSPFTIHLLLSSSLFPMLYASFATDNGLLTTDA
jgi:hypothetical protein